MTQSNNPRPVQPLVGTTLLTMLVSAAMIGAFAQSATAQSAPVAEARVAVTAGPETAERIRRQIAGAARAACADSGVAGLYRGGAARCREALIADAERQLAGRASEARRLN